MWRSLIYTIETEELKERNVDPEEVKAALAMAAAVRRTSKGWDSTREIRKWREQRK